MPTGNLASTQVSKADITSDGWQAVIIRRTRGKGADVRMLPIHERGNAIAVITPGQKVLLRLDMERDGWVPVRVERLLGWVYLDDIRYGTKPRPASNAKSSTSSSA